MTEPLQAGLELQAVQLPTTNIVLVFQGLQHKPTRWPPHLYQAQLKLVTVIYQLVKMIKDYGALYPGNAGFYLLVDLNETSTA